MPAPPKDVGLLSRKRKESVDMSDTLSQDIEDVVNESESELLKRIAHAMSGTLMGHVRMDYEIELAKWKLTRS